MLAYIKARAGELSSIASASGLTGDIAAWLLGKIDGRTALVGAAVCLVGYFMPQDKPVAQLVGNAVLDATKKMLWLAVLAGLAAGGLVACSGGAATTGNAIATAAQSPTAQALINGVNNFSGPVGQVVAKVNQGLAVTQQDKAMVCGGMAWANAGFNLLGPALGASASDQQTEQAAMTAVNAICAGNTGNLAGAVATVASAYQQTAAKLQQSGAPVTVPAPVVPAAAAPAAAAPASK